MNEIELKFLNIDVDEIKRKLKEIGAELKYDTHVESISFTADGFSGSDSSQKYLRVRKVDGEVEMTYKDPEIDSHLSEREEINISTSDFGEAVRLLEKLGFSGEKLFKKHRIHYELGDIHFELDTLQNIPTYLEIETQNQADMKTACDLLGLDMGDGKKGTIVEILPEKFKD